MVQDLAVLLLNTAAFSLAFKFPCGTSHNRAAQNMQQFQHASTAIELWLRLLHSWQLVNPADGASNTSEGPCATDPMHYPCHKELASRCA